LVAPASTSWSRPSKQFESDLRQQIDRGKDSFERREYAAALTDFQEVLSRNPDLADVRHFTGLCLSILGHSEAALIEFDHAITINPNYIEAHINRAITLNEVGRYDEGRHAFARAAQLETASKGPYSAAASARIANAHASLGDLYREAGAYKEAINEYRRALEIRGQFHDIRVRLAEVLLQTQQPANAAVELRTVLESNPRFIAARLALGLAYFRLGDRAAAMLEWSVAHDQDPDNAQVRAYLAMLESASARAREHESTRTGREPKNANA
jgi:tetratricopeptide (TPR) repeat protein